MRIRSLTLPALLAATAIGISGCNYVVLLGYLIGGPPSISPDFDEMTATSLTDKDVIVAVVCYAPKEVLYDYSRVDRDIARYISYQMTAKKIKVINPDVVQKWLDENSNWDEPSEIGEAVGATHVVYIDITKYSLYEENSHELYRGRSEVDVTVYELDEDGEGEPIYSTELLSRFPLAAAQDSSEISRPGFQARYHRRLSEEVGRLFYEHYAGDDIPDAT
ncbi:MAG: hypothetical protein O2820_06700 [Planctomycetota bacterium]|nr:hypothetical protein [Planctomycetota bacterium]MDA1248898.1 hypothetical protein [Planctomycetota bacterium]